MRDRAGLRSHRAIAATGEQVACYDNKVGAVLGAVDSGDVRLIGREQMRKTKLLMLGSTTPDDEAQDPGLFETTIASGGLTSPVTWRFTTEEGEANRLKAKPPHPTRPQTSPRAPQQRRIAAAASKRGRTTTPRVLKQALCPSVPRRIVAFAQQPGLFCDGFDSWRWHKNRMNGKCRAAMTDCCSIHLLRGLIT